MSDDGADSLIGDDDLDRRGVRATIAANEVKGGDEDSDEDVGGIDDSLMEDD